MKYLQYLWVIMTTAMVMFWTMAGAIALQQDKNWDAILYLAMAALLAYVLIWNLER